MKEYFQYSRIQVRFPVAAEDKHEQTECRHYDFIFKYFSIFYKGKFFLRGKHVHS